MVQIQRLTSTTIFAILSLVIKGINGAAFGEQCTSTSECTDVNTYCVKYRECTIGTCQCVSGYGNANGNACDKVLRHYNQACDSNNVCLDVNQECDASTGLCVCTKWNTYNYLENKCITVTRYVLTESCGGWYQLQCYIDTSAGGQCDSTCQCQEGYTAATWETYLACRRPIYGEHCAYGVACQVSFDTSTVSDDVTSTAPECRQNTCLCPPSHEHKLVMGYNLCLNKVEDGYQLKDHGEECTYFNECQSSLCVKCLGSTTGVCMANDRAVDISPSLSMVTLSSLVATTAFWLL